MRRIFFIAGKQVVAGFIKPSQKQISIAWSERRADIAIWGRLRETRCQSSNYIGLIAVSTDGIATMKHGYTASHAMGYMCAVRRRI